MECIWVCRNGRTRILCDIHVWARSALVEPLYLRPHLLAHVAGNVHRVDTSLYVTHSSRPS